MHTLKTTILGSSVFVSEADISPYSVYCHSLGNIQKQLQGETCFKLSESKQSFNSVSLTNTQQSSLEDTFVWCFRQRFTAIAEILGFGCKNAFSASSQKASRNYCKHTLVSLCKLNAHVEDDSVR